VTAVALIKAPASFRWPNGVIPFVIDRSIPVGDPVRTNIQAAMNLWQGASPIVFIPRTSESDFIRFIRVANKTRCGAAVGRKGGMQDIPCGPTASIRSIAHELGHVIGLFHEQQRPDRDAMVAVSSVALRDEPQNYERLDHELMIGAYDFTSVMHYSFNVAATDRIALTKIHPDPAVPGGVPSPGDLEAPQFMYGVVPLRTPIAAHSRNSNHMEVWVIDSAGTLRGAWFDGQWQTWYHLWGQALPVGGHVAACGRSSDHMELFAVGTDSQLHGIWFNGAWQPWYSLGAPNAAGLPPSAPIAALSRNHNHMEFWVVGKDKQLHGSWFQGSWKGWYTLGGRSFAPGAHVVALKRNAQHMEVWAIGEDHLLHGNWWDGSSWRGWYTLNDGVGPRLLSGGGLAVLSRNDDHMEIWSIGGDDRLHGIWFDGQWRDWYSLGAPAGTAFPAGAPLAALSRNDDHMEVWSVSNAGRVEGNWWDGAWRGWYSPDPGMPLPAGSHLGACSRNDDHMELWTVGPDSPNAWIPGVQGVWFNGVWNPFFRVI
jgi:hypothetical protein